MCWKLKFSRWLHKRNNSRNSTVTHYGDQISYVPCSAISIDNKKHTNYNYYYCFLTIIISLAVLSNVYIYIHHSKLYPSKPSLKCSLIHWISLTHLCSHRPFLILTLQIPPPSLPIHTTPLSTALHPVSWWRPQLQRPVGKGDNNRKTALLLIPSCYTPWTQANVVSAFWV